MSIVDSRADWPADVVVDALEIVAGLVWRRPAKTRLPLSEALSQLEELSKK